VATGQLPAPAPSVSTVARLLRTLRAPEPAPAEAPPDGPPRRPILPVYERAAAARGHYRLLDPEAVLLRALVREAVAELDRPDGDPRARPRPREPVAQLVLTLLRGS